MCNVTKGELQQMIMALSDRLHQLQRQAEDHGVFDEELGETKSALDKARVKLAELSI